VPASPTAAAIGTVTLGLSNVHVLYGAHPILVDTGSPDEFDDLEEELGDIGVKLADVKCAVVTHLHADHAGNARELQRLVTLEQLRCVVERGLGLLPAPPPGLDLAKLEPQLDAVGCDRERLLEIAGGLLERCDRTRIGGCARELGDRPRVGAG